MQIDRSGIRVEPRTSILPEACQPKNRPLLRRIAMVSAFHFVLGVSLMLGQQQAADTPTPQTPPQGAATGGGGSGAGGNPQAPATKGDVAAIQQTMQQQMKQLRDDLKAQEEESDYLLVLGVGSLV